MLELAKRIIAAYKGKGLVTGFIYGKFAHGKTSYLLHTAREVFGAIYKLRNVDAWLMALDHLFFDPIEAMAYIEAYRSKNPHGRVVVLGMDDVGQHIPRARWWREDVVQFREWMTVARSDVSAVLFTAPTQLSLPGGIIDACFLRLHVRRHPERRDVSVAYGYEVSVSPYFQVNVSGPIFRDEFPRHYPNFVFEEYERMRQKMVAPLRRYLIGLMGLDKTIETLNRMGATHETIGRIVGKERSTITKRLRAMKSEPCEIEA
jgi:hypothetical protein